MTKPETEKLDSHGIKALERCERELQKFIELAGDYDLDEMSVQALQTAIESMQMRREGSLRAQVGGEPQDPDKARIGIAHTGKLGDAFPQITTPAPAPDETIKPWQHLLSGDLEVFATQFPQTAERIRKAIYASAHARSAGGEGRDE
jgi:hypothetical protein